MTNEELEQQIEHLEQEIINLKLKLKLKLAESKVEKKPYEVEVPEDIDDYYITDNYGEIYTLDGFSKEFVHSNYQRGLAFKTREEAVQHLKESMLLFKLHKWAEEHNGDWFPDWENEDERKYFIEYDSRFGSLDFDSYQMFNQFSKLPYFKSEEIVEKFIKEFGDEIKEVLC